MAVQPIFDVKNVLVLGGAGFIGSHLCDELAKNSKVICVDNFVTGDEKNIDHLLQNPNFKFIKHDMTKPLNLKEHKELEIFKIDFQGIQEIYNLACPTSPRQFEDKKIDTVLANSLAVKNALDLVVNYKAQFLHFSSSVVYGPRTKEVPKVPEEYPGFVDFLSPRAVYDEGKRFAETMIEAYRSAYSLNTKIIRVFRTYGSRMKLDDGHMVADFVNDALEGKDLVIYGDESFSTTLVHVSDIVTAAIKMMKSAEPGPLNIGSEVEVRLVDVANLVLKLTQSKSQIRFEDPLLFMTPLPIPDIDMAKQKINWFPVVRLEDGLKETIDYLKATKGLIRAGTINV